MTGRRPLGLLIALPLLLGGCLLPQPDTPPIPPFAGAATSGKASAPQRAAASPSPTAAGGAIVAEDANRAAASTPPAMPVPAASEVATGEPGADAGGTAAGSTTALAPASPGGMPPAMGVSKAASGRLVVSFTGDDVTEVWLELTTGGGGAGMPVTDDAFTVDLPAGEYVLELTVGGKRLRTTKPVAVPAGGERTLAVEVAGDVITIEESVPLAAPSEGPSPAPSTDPDGPA